VENEKSTVSSSELLPTKSKGVILETDAEEGKENDTPLQM
jgi:hypothetical protein